MTATLRGTSKVSLDVVYNANFTGYSHLSKILAGPNGTNDASFPDVTLSYGTGTVLDGAGAIPCNDIFFWQGTIAAGATKSIDLTGGSDANPDGVALAFTVVKYFLVANLGLATGAAPDGIQSLQVGPRNVTNAWQGPWGGVGATVYETVYWRLEYAGPAAGITVTAGTGDLFIVKNPGASDMTVLIFIAGKK